MASSSSSIAAAPGGSSSSSSPLVDALAAIAAEVDITAVSAIAQQRHQSRAAAADGSSSSCPLSLMGQQSLYAVLKVAERQCGEDSVRKWLSTYLQQSKGTAAPSTASTSLNTSAVTAAGQQKAASSSRPSSRKSSPTRVSSRRASSPPRSAAAVRSSAASSTGTAAPPPHQSVGALRSSGMAGNNANGPVVASRRSTTASTASGVAPFRRGVSQGPSPTDVGPSNFDRSNTAHSRASSTGRTPSMPRVHTPTGERPSVVASGPAPTKVGNRQAPSATSYRTSASSNANGRSSASQRGSAVSNAGGSGVDISRRSAVNSTTNSGYNTPSRAPRSVSVGGAGATTGSIAAVAAAAVSHTNQSSIINSNHLNPNTIAGRKAAAIRLREMWAAHVTAASRTLGSLSIHVDVRVETLTTLHDTLADGIDELVKHALNADDFFCVTCGKLMPLLNHQLQAVDVELTGLIVSVVALMVEAMGPLFAGIVDTYYSRLLWLLDCPAMGPIYDTLAAHCTMLVERIHHERMLCHLVDHIRWLDRKGDPLPHSIEISKQLATAVHNDARNVATSERSRQMCMTLSLQLLELTVRRCCAKVQYSIDELIHPNDYLLPYLDDLYCSDEQRRQCLPAFVVGKPSATTTSSAGDAAEVGKDAADARHGQTRFGTDVSCIIEIFRKCIAKREGVDPRIVKVHKLPSYVDLEDGEDLYDFGRHPLLKAYEFISQHTGKGLQEVTRDAVGGPSSKGRTTPTASPSTSPQRAHSPRSSVAAGGCSPNSSIAGGVGYDPLIMASNSPQRAAARHYNSSGSSAPPPPSLDTVARYNAAFSNAINPLNTSAAMFHISANNNNNVGNPMQRSSGGAPREVAVTTDELARTITNDDFKHKLGRQSVERMRFVTAVAARLWETLILPIVGDTTRPAAALPHAHHIFEGFLALFPIHGAQLFARDVALEQRRLITRKLLDKGVRHMYNFPLFMRSILDDLSVEEIGGPIDSVSTITPMVDSPPTRLGQMHLRQVRGNGTTVGGGGSSAPSRRLVATTVGGVSVGRSSVGGGSQAGAAASLMMGDRAASPNLFAMMGRVPNPEATSRIALRAPSPRVASAPRASSVRSGAASHYGGASSAASAHSGGGVEPFHRSVSAGTSGASHHGSAVGGGISLSTLARIADPHGTNGTIKIKTPRGARQSAVSGATGLSKASGASGPSPAPAAPSALATNGGSGRKTATMVTIVEAQPRVSHQQRGGGGGGGAVGGGGGIVATPRYTDPAQHP